MYTTYDYFFFFSSLCVSFFIKSVHSTISIQYSTAVLKHLLTHIAHASRTYIYALSERTDLMARSPM